MASSELAIRSGMGVLGGWLAILPPTVLTLALRANEWSVSATAYANLLAIGWLTMLVMLVFAGRFNDFLLARTGSRLLMVRVGAPLIAVSGVLLAVSPSMGWLSTAWIFAQIPSAMVITAALAISGDMLPPDRRGIASGLVGAAPILALLVGSFLVRVMSDSLSLAFALPALVGSALAIPLMRGQQGTREHQDEPNISVTSLTHNSAWIWVIFVIGSFILSWAISTTNGFIVLFVEFVTDVANSDVTSANVVIVAALLAVISSLVAGLASKGKPRSLGMWIVAAFLCGIALIVLLVAPTIAGVYVSAVLLGVSFGVANGLELAVVLMLRNNRHHLGRDLGVFTAATTAPFVLVPTVASVMVRGDTGSGLSTLFGLAAASAIAAGVVVLVTVIVDYSRLRVHSHT